MSYFLWVEDFQGTPVDATAKTVLGSIIKNNSFDSNKKILKDRLKDQGIFIELTFEDSLKFIKDELNKIDYIILDINLPPHDEEKTIDTISDDVLQLLYKFEDYTEIQYQSKDEDLFKKACEALQKIAGFYLYTHLVVELGFPKEHILFCSNHGGEATEIKKAFKTAKILLPDIHTKDSILNYSVKDWVEKRHSNSYSRLRRGIIEGCKYLKSLTEEKLRFNNFIQEQDKQITLEDLHNYLDVLENFLPLREPPNKKDKDKFYKLFVRTLAHEWESATPWKSKTLASLELYAFTSIMKLTRNWSAHSRVFEELKEQDVAYLFIVNMRSMFFLDDDLLGYEKHLLQLKEFVISEQDVINKIALEKSYSNLLALLDEPSQTDFYYALDDLQRSNTQDDNYLIQGLYQTFWILTSRGSFDEIKRKDGITKHYKFPKLDYFKAQKDNYLFELARHIYKRSFDD
jgi:hypothetical protein